MRLEQSMFWVCKTLQCTLWLQAALLRWKNNHINIKKNFLVQIIDMINLAISPYEWYLLFTYYGYNMLLASMSFPTCLVSAWFLDEVWFRTPLWAKVWKTGRSTYHRLQRQVHTTSGNRARKLTVLVVGDIFGLQISSTDTATHWTNPWQP